MLNDIKQTSEALKALLDTHIAEDKNIKGINIPINPSEINNIYIIASGSSRNAANMAKYFIEKVAQIPVIVEYAGEFANRTPCLKENDLFIALSQSGETADVLAALKKALSMGINAFAITNNPDSTIHKLSKTGINIQAGKEESIPATKSFTCQFMALYILGIYLAESKKTCFCGGIKQKLLEIPVCISANIEAFSEKVSDIALKLKEFRNLMILGRGQNFPLAEEFALKIQETCYINAFGWAAGEFMHGHLAVLEEDFPVISLLTRSYDDSPALELAIKNTKKVINKRNPLMLTIGHGSDTLNIDKQDDIITPFLTILMIQLLTYKTATLLGHDVSSPRGLSKTVSSE